MTKAKSTKCAIKGSEWVNYFGDRERITIRQIKDADGNKTLGAPLEGTECVSHYPDTWTMELEIAPAPERAREGDGTFAGDDPATPEKNEAWEDGKGPEKKTPAKKGSAKKKKK